MVSQGEFREDLFYRLNVIPIYIPKLSERKDDIPILVTEFINRFSKNSHITVSHELLGIFKNYNWPGNVRELENLIERIVILRKSDELSVDDLPQDFNKDEFANKISNQDSDDSYLSFHDSGKKVIINALTKFGWNKSKSAKYLQIPRHVLIYRMKKYNIRNNQNDI